MIQKIEQNNYSNTYLKVIGEKLDRIENKVDPVTIKSTNKNLDIEKPLFTPHEIPPELRIQFKKYNTNLLEEISKRSQTMDTTKLVSLSKTHEQAPQTGIQEQNDQIKRIQTIDKK